MATRLKDNIGCLTASSHSGTGSFVFTGTGAGAIAGFRDPYGNLTDGAAVCYHAELSTTEWESGMGIWTASSRTLTRARILASSNSDTIVNFAAGSKSVYVGLSGDLADILFPDTKGILVHTEVYPNAAPYYAKRSIGVKAGHPFLFNGVSLFDGSTENFLLEADTAVNFKDYLKTADREIAVTSAPYTVVAPTDIGKIIIFTSGATGSDIQLPTAASAGKGACFTFGNATSNTYDILRASTDTIAYSNTEVKLPSQGYITLVSDGSAAWHIRSFFPGYGTAGTLLQSGGISGTVATLPSWVTFASVLTTLEASQAEAEAATANDRYLSPGKIFYSPSACKGWGEITLSGGTPTLQSPDHNIASITDNGAGDFTFTLSVAFSSANAYTVVATPETPPGIPMYVYVKDAGKTSGACRVICRQESTGMVDPLSISIAFFGDT